VPEFQIGDAGGELVSFIPNNAHIHYSCFFPEHLDQSTDKWITAPLDTDIDLSGGNLNNK